MARLEEELQARGARDPASRRAKFVCSLCLANPLGSVQFFNGTVEGHLVWPPRGEKGFGYDPMFVPGGYEQTFGEMDPAKKHEISHRAAFVALQSRCPGVMRWESPAHLLPRRVHLLSIFTGHFASPNAPIAILIPMPSGASAKTNTRPPPSLNCAIMPGRRPIVRSPASFLAAARPRSWLRQRWQPSSVRQRPSGRLTMIAKLRSKLTRQA